MKKKLLVSVVAVNVLFLGMVGGASATLFDFNYSTLGYSDGGDTYDNVGMTADGIGVTVTAYTIDNNGVGAISSKTHLKDAAGGVYVSSNSSPVDGNLGVYLGGSDSHSIEGLGSDEGLLFSYDQRVSLDYINFDKFSSIYDDFNLTVDGTTLLVDWNATGTSPLVTDVKGEFDEYSFNNITGKEFLFWADSSSDSFRIDYMNVSAVPEPASMLLFGSGILGLFGFSRKKRA